MKNGEVTWYSVGRWDIKITPVGIIRETDKFVVLPNGRRDAKVTEYNCYFPTWDEAYDHMLNQANAGLRRAQAELASAEKRVRLVEAYKDSRPND